MTAEGIVCFISNYSWLDGLSFTGMRERYLEAFDSIRVDCLNGDKYKTGKLTPDGKPDPSVFSTERNREGIQVGTAIAPLSRKRQHHAINGVLFRDLWVKRNWRSYSRMRPTRETQSMRSWFRRLNSVCHSSPR
jgi:predicted helicase